MEKEQFNALKDLFERFVTAKEKTEKSTRRQTWIRTSLVVLGAIVFFAEVVFVGTQVFKILQSLNTNMADTNMAELAAQKNLKFDYLAGDINSENKIVVIPIKGLISEESYQGKNVVEDVGLMLNVAKEDPSVKAVILEIQSPGGDVNASDVIYHKLANFKLSGKPLVAFFYGLAASGGYYIAMTSDKIVATPETLTGSIGVMMQVPNFSGLLRKIGVEFNTIKSGKSKDMLSPFKPVDANDNKIAQDLIDGAFNRFVEKVSNGRKLSKDMVYKLADGRIYDAYQAVANGLVDRIGYLNEEAFEEAIKLAKLPSAQLVRYKKQNNFFNEFFAQSGKIQFFSAEELPSFILKPGMYYLPEGYFGK